MTEHDETGTFIFLGPPMADLNDSRWWNPVGFTDGPVIFDAGDPIEDFPAAREPVTIGFDPSLVGPEAMAIMVGGKVHTYPPAKRAQSLLIEHAEMRSGAPGRPLPRTGWRGRLDRLTGRHCRALIAYCDRWLAWYANGCPDVETRTRTYIPSATLEAVEDEPGGTRLTYTVGASTPAPDWSMDCYNGKGEPS